MMTLDKFEEASEKVKEVVLPTNLIYSEYFSAQTGGCREKNETLIDCIKRECKEELGLKNIDFSYIGLMYYHMAPGYFHPEWHDEYGALYGISLPIDYMEYINKYRTDKEEIEKLAFYRDLKGKEKIAKIDEKLLEYWNYSNFNIDEMY